MENHINFIRSITRFLDKEFKIFGYRIGFDPLIGLIPILGDILPAVFGLYFLWIGINLKLPKMELLRIIRNSILDILLGLVPVLGDFSDFIYKANIKNLEIIEKYHKSNVIEGEKIG